MVGAFHLQVDRRSARQTRQDSGREEYASHCGAGGPSRRQVVRVGGRPAYKARQYTEELNKSIAPWAFAQSEPLKTIAGLGLFGS